ncbi:hypothetical protein [Photobacterium damselae]|uniref:F4 family fimbrial subunit n=1 Tax=Photobacterium damselae TaxID=38293 RepID=UPI001F30B147|nr:hypothetical protein [Photobacterium damselae]UKA03986.1 hypothetical protein IHC89_15775 [Photobacterium damselae subsp. damselae]
MNLKLIALSLALASGSALATPPSGGTGNSNTAAGGWQQTSESGGFTGDVTLQGTIEKIKLPWMWQVGNGSAVDKDGKAIFEIGSDQFQKGTQGSVQMGSNQYVFTTLQPDEPIEFLKGYTKEAFSSAGKGITPKVEVENSEKKPVELVYTNEMKTIRVSATGQDADGNDIQGALDLKIGAALTGCANTSVGSSTAIAAYCSTSGYSKSLEKSKTVLKDNFTDFTTKYTNPQYLSNDGSKTASKIFDGTALGGGYKFSAVTGGFYSGIYEATVYWGGSKLPATWTAPVKITVTML